MIHREEENHYTLSYSYSYSYSYDSGTVIQPYEATELISQVNEENVVTKLTNITDNVIVDSVNHDSNSPSLATSTNGDSTIANITDTSLENVSADSNDMESVSLLAKSMIGLGIGFTALVALFSLRKKRRGSLN